MVAGVCLMLQALCLVNSPTEAAARPAAFAVVGHILDHPVSCQPTSQPAQDLLHVQQRTKCCSVPMHLAVLLALIGFKIYLHADFMMMVMNSCSRSLRIYAPIMCLNTMCNLASSFWLSCAT
jgi:hypothetical protein